ncbi:hypothetical protein R83H12_03031 [Fibrobacteria bacterium R8-3-H12]
MSEPKFTEFSGFTECRGNPCGCPLSEPECTEFILQFRKVINTPNNRSIIMKTTRRFLSAAISIAITFTLSCSDDKDDGGDNPSGGDTQGGCPNAVTTPVNAEGIGSVSCGGETYKTVKIGEQVWMAKNLNYRGIEPDTLGKCSANDPSNCNKYGRLYNWATAMGIDAKYNDQSWSGSDVKHRGICPSGWHIPSDAEWDVLMIFINPSCPPHPKSFYCDDVGTKLKATSGWNNSGDKSGNGTDDYGFAALPGGWGYSDGHFNFVGTDGYWWSATESGGSKWSYIRNVSNNRNSIYWDENGHKFAYLSVRCVINYPNNRTTSGATLPNSVFPWGLARQPICSNSCACLCAKIFWHPFL